MHHLVRSDFFFGILVIPELRLTGTDTVVKITDRFQIARGAVSAAEVPEKIRGIIECLSGVGRDPHKRAGIVDQHLAREIFQLNVYRVVSDGFDRKFGTDRSLFRRLRRPDILFGEDCLSIQIFHGPIDSDFLIRRSFQMSGHGRCFIRIIDIADLPGFHHHADRSPFQNCAIDFDRRRRFGWLAATVDIVVISLEQTAHHFKVQEGIFLHEDHVLDLADIQIKGDKKLTVAYAFYIRRQGSRFTPGQRDGLICDHLWRAAGIVGAVKTGQACSDIGCHLLFRIGRERAEDIRPVVLGDGNAADEAVRHGIEGGPGEIAVALQQIGATVDLAESRCKSVFFPAPGDHKIFHPGNGDHVIIGRYRNRLITRGDGSHGTIAYFRFGANRTRRQGDFDLIEYD